MPPTMSRRDRMLRKAAQDRGLKGPTPRGEYRICCPWCELTTGEADTKYKLQLNPKKGIWHCFKCDVGGTADLSWLGKLEVRDRDDVEFDMGPPDGYVSLQTASDRRGLAVKPYVEYLLARGMNDSHFGPLRVGCCLKGKYANRVIIPDIQMSATTKQFGWHGFVARAIYKHMRPKYLYPAGMKKARQVWGINTTEVDEVFVVEGVFDALPLVPHAVAVYGKNISEEQLDVLADLHTKRLIVCFDGDAWEECHIAAMRLSLRGCRAEVGWCKLPPATDPGELGQDVRKYIVAGNE